MVETINPDLRNQFDPRLKPWAMEEIPIFVLKYNSRYSENDPTFQARFI